MTILGNYQQFGGRHPETGSVHNVLSYQGVTAPHSEDAPSEALLLGVSGGITVGYFFFEYKGFDPHLALMTRNTFDPLQTLLERLGVQQTAKQSANPEKGHENLLDALANGEAPIVWADIFSLPYNAYDFDPRDHRMMPLVVYGHDGDTVHIADQAAVGLTAPAEDFAQARARVKKLKFRVLTLGAPNFDKLPKAVEDGIRQCIALYVDKPPMGAVHNFGLAALEHFVEMLTNTRNKNSWARYFAPGRKMFAGLVGYNANPGLWGWIDGWGDGGAERGRYADFLDEAAEILGKGELKESAEIFRQSQKQWAQLAKACLPDEHPRLAEARQLLEKRHTLFIKQGNESLDERKKINAKIEQLREQAAEDFSLSDEEVVDLRDSMAEIIWQIRNTEKRAVESMQAALE